MSQSTTYTCDRCGHTSTFNSDWGRDGSAYYSKDYCPSCVKQLLKIGAEAEEANKTKKAAEVA